MMKGIRNIFMFAVPACFIYGCAVEPAAIPNEDAIDEFEAWIDTYYPEPAAEKTPLGVYILQNEAGTQSGENTGADNADNADFIKVNYIVRDLKGKISSANTEEMAKKLGTYDSEEDAVNYYGPAVWDMKNNSVSVGIKEILKGMKVGETRTGAIPSWLSTTAIYQTEEEYRKNVTGGSHSIYEINVEEVITKVGEQHKNAIDGYQIDNLIIPFIERHSEGEKAYDNPMPGFEEKRFPTAILDTTWQEDIKNTYRGSSYGFYFDNGKPFPLTEGEEQKEGEESRRDSMAFKNTDTTLMINYTGRRLLPKYNEKGQIIKGEYDEQIFDTTIENLAKDAGIYKAGKTYKPVQVKWSTTASGITLGGNKVIPGFYNALWRMQFKHKVWEDQEKDAGAEPSEFRKAVAIFFSPYGYGTGGSGSMIPGYAPLMFEIEIIKEEKEDK